MRRAPILLAALLATAPALAEPFVPGDQRAVDLVKAHVTDGYVTVGRTIAHAERISRGAFALTGYQVEQRPNEPFKHVRICYRLGIDPPPARWNIWSAPTRRMSSRPTAMTGSAAISNTGRAPS